MEKFDAIIIGVGQAGSPLAGTLVKEGFKTAVIERSHVGGSCVNYGCTPTKTMVASARVSHLSKKAASFGITNQQTQTNFKEVIKRRDKVVETWRKGVLESLEGKDKLEFIKGEACFTGEKQVTVSLPEGGSRKLEADKIFINTGTSPRLPELEGLDHTPYYTAKSMMELKELPEHLFILGGSYIGLEFGQMYARLGSKVSILETGTQLAGREDKDIAEALQEVLEKEGLAIYLEAKPEKVGQEGGKLNLGFQSRQTDRTLTGTHLLLATGTRPNTAVLQLDKGGIETNEQGYIKVNEYLQTSSKGVYALGDCKGGPEFTHISYDDFRIIRDHLFGEKKRSTTDRPVPYTMFTKPELGRIGLTEKEARQQGRKYMIARMPAKKMARAVETNQTEGMVKVLIDAENDRLLGAACLTAEGGELMAVLQVAMMGKLPYQQLRDGVFAHPTWAESLNNLFAELQEPE